MSELKVILNTADGKAEVRSLHGQVESVEVLATLQELQSVVDTTLQLEQPSHVRMKAVGQVVYRCVVPFQDKAPDFMSTHQPRHE